MEEVSLSSSDSAGEKPHVLVTGATGFVAGHIVQQLCEKGYKVRGTVRSLSNRKRLGYLNELCPSNPPTLFEANLMKNGSFDDAVNGCSIVFHIASPFILDVKDPKKELVDPAVNGVKNVFASCIKHGVQTVVMTSSIAAIAGYASDNPPGKKFSESDWNMTSTLEKGSYYFSKTLAERAAWEIMRVKENPFRLVCINPSLILGPLQNNRMAESMNLLRDLCNRAYPACPKMALGIVDVRDVALAHILAAENPKAKGRYICDAGTMWFREVAEAINKKYPGINAPTGELWNGLVYVASLFDGRMTLQDCKRNLGVVPLYDNTRIKDDLGLQFRPLEESIIGAVDSLADRRLIEDRRRAGKGKG